MQYMVEGSTLTSMADTLRMATNSTEDITYPDGFNESINYILRNSGISNSTIIEVDATSGEKVLYLSLSNSNTEWRYVYASGITSLVLTTNGDSFTNDKEAYYTVVFISGTTATSISNRLEAYFTGDDCVEGVFTPAASKTYDLGVWWNGMKW
jgi:hypothetical protein